MRFYLAIPKSKVIPQKSTSQAKRADLRNMLKFVATQAKTCKRCGG